MNECERSRLQKEACCQCQHCYDEQRSGATAITRETRRSLFCPACGKQPPCCKQLCLYLWCVLFLSRSLSLSLSLFFYHVKRRLCCLSMLYVFTRMRCFLARAVTQAPKGAARGRKQLSDVLHKVDVQVNLLPLVGDRNLGVRNIVTPPQNGSTCDPMDE